MPPAVKPVPVVPPSPKAAPGRDSVFEAVYFEFDHAEVRTQDSARLASYAEYLKTHPGTRLLVVGYCDPLGSIEYNRALGWRRAENVRNRLMQHGVDGNRLETFSYGSEAVTYDDPDLFWVERRCGFQLLR